MDDYLRDFVQETENSITDLNNALLELENDPGNESAMDRIFRMAHTIKGNCGAMGFTKAADLAHAVEDLLDEMRAGRIAVTPETMDEVFDGVDTLEAMVDEAREHEKPQTNPKEVITRLRSAIEEAPGPDVRIEDPDDRQIETALEDIDGPAEPEQLVYHVRLAVSEQDARGEGMLVLEALADAFDVLTTNPPQNVIRNEDYGGSFDAVISSAISANDIGAALEAVDQVDDAIVTDVSDRVDEVGDDVEPIEVEDMEVEELLESVSEFDDIDAMADEIAEEEAMEELGDAGTFEELEVDDDDIEIAGLLEDEELADASEIEQSDLGDMKDLEPAEPQDANEVFKELQGEVEEVAYEELEPELEALEFDEYSDEDELSFEELMAEADEEPAPEDEDLAAFDSEFDEDDGVEEFDELFEEEGGAVSDDELDEVLAEAEETTSGGDEVSFEDLVAEAENELDADSETPAETEPEVVEPIDDEPIDPDDLSGRDLTEIESIRVEVGQVDSLLTQVEQLVTNRLRLRRAIEEGDSTQALNELDELETLTMQMQDTVMDVRLVPLSQVVGNLPRVVRDLARDQGKQVDFAVEGGDVELDRRILSELGDPLLHLVRNAVDHGVESPEDREAAGKDGEGELRIRARRTRDRVTIEVTDDGRGLDTGAIAEQAIEEDLVTREQVDGMSDREIHELIFEPGFSTAPEVTGVSGRGVGMDVVRETVLSLDGAVGIRSEPGNGTTITLRVPVSVAIVRVLFVESGGEEYGIPVKNVDEISQAAAIESVNGEDVLTFGDSVYPIINLTEALETPGPSANGSGMLVRMNDEVRQVALHCDEVLRQEEVVVKPFEGLLSGIPGLSGAAVLGEGDVVTILDVETL